MRQLFIDKKTLSVHEVAQPLLDEYSLLVEVHFSFISSGTETATIEEAKKNILLTNIPQKIKKVLSSVSEHGISGTAALIKGRLAGTMQTLGYSCSGKVLATGSKISKFRVGDFVACAGAGFANHADMVCVPENLVVLVKETILKEASLTTIGAIALQGIRRAQLQLGDRVCIIGLGLLGQISLQLAKLSGCSVIGIDLVDERLALAKELGATAVYKATDENIYNDIAFLTEHHGVDSTIITAASKSNSIIQQAMEVTRKKGKVILVGDVGLEIERAPFYQKEIDFLISCSYGPGRYDSSYEQRNQDYPFAYVRWTENRNMQAFVELLESRKLTTEKLITTEIGFESVHKAYTALEEKKCLGVVVHYNPKAERLISNAPKIMPASTADFKPARKDTIRIGVVGAGGFAKVKLLPLIQHMNNVTINAIVDTDIANALNISRLYRNAQSLVDINDLFEQDLVDAVIISSPHKYHCEQALTALRHHKAVFLEKPMVTTFEQLERFSSFLLQEKVAPLCVDYNRTHAPFIQKIKHVTAQRNTPLMIHYRMNAGFIPKDHWVQTEVGAGRIIGEACHIIDLFCFLVEAAPVAVSVESMNTARDDIGPSDNFSVQISFADGSICTLMYTAIGNSKLGKERMELFFDSKSIVMEDYLTLEAFGLPNGFNEKKLTAQKGHAELLKKFFDYLQGIEKNPPFSMHHLLQTARLTLTIDALACQGGGTTSLSVKKQEDILHV